MNCIAILRLTPHALLSVLAMTLMAELLYSPTAQAYEQYSGGVDGGCIDCHGDFRAANYISPVDDLDWGNLHNLHRTTMLASDCNTCHTGDANTRFPVFTNSSNGGVGLDAVSCVGCHGRLADVSATTGEGAGLRQHHYRANVTLCADCHFDANPANFTPVGEHVLPAYYFVPDAAHPDKPTNPCNPAGEEDYAGSTIGLDNDGDLLRDGSDPDCVPPPDTDLDGVPDASDNCPTIANPGQEDGAAGLEINPVTLAASPDGVGDACDNCVRVNNPRVYPGLAATQAAYLAANPWAILSGGQRDDDHDGYGNKCDADFTATGVTVGPDDLTQYRAASGKARSSLTACGVLGTATPPPQRCSRFDLNESAVSIGPDDLTQYRRMSGKTKGPRCATHCTGATTGLLPCASGSAVTCNSP